MKNDKLRRIIALTGIILLLALYASTMVFALMKSPYAKGLLMSAVFCTIVVPVIVYAMTLVAKNVRGRAVPRPDDETVGSARPDDEADGSARPDDDFPAEGSDDAEEPAPAMKDSDEEDSDGHSKR